MKNPLRALLNVSALSLLALAMYLNFIDLNRLNNIGNTEHPAKVKSTTTVEPKATKVLAHR